MKELYVFPTNDYRSFLLHHGIKGQKWGVRNAEWYPIADWQAHLGRIGGEVTSTGKRGIKAIADANATRKRKRANAIAIKKRKETIENKKNIEKVKQYALKNGTPGDVVKVSPYLTMDELDSAYKRQRTIQNLRDLENQRIESLSKKRRSSASKKVKEMSETVATVSTNAEKTARAYKRILTILPILS